MKIRNVRCTLVLMSVFLLEYVHGQTLTPDASRSKILFSINNLGIRVDGRFPALSGKIIFSADRLEVSAFEIEIPVEALETGIHLRDTHLKNAAYFDSKNYPAIFFKSKALRKITAVDFEMTGLLTIRNVTRQVIFPFRTIKLTNGCQFVGELTINRRDFSVGKKSLTMSDHVRIQINVIAVVDTL